jgi:hypothetical protein
VLIDGHFEHTAAVWHKELLFALERKTAVYGAASMGALRAAELHRFGMVGVGQIAAAFRRGQLMADDEVAIAHGPAELGYPRFSEALVNLRDGLRRAQAAGVVSAPVAAALVALAKARFFRERSWPELFADGERAGLPRRALAALARWVDRVRPDRKAADARLVLGRVARGPLERPARPIVTARTWFFVQALRSRTGGSRR